MNIDNGKNHKLSTFEKRKLISIRRHYTNPVIGITGSFGKSTLVEMLTAVLESRGKILKTPRGKGLWENNLSILKRLDNSYKYAIFEFDYQRGKNFAGLLRLIKPNFGIVTNIGDAHLSYLKDAMRMALQRSEVVKYLVQNGTAILNQDDELGSALSQYIATPNIYKFGLNQNADFCASDIEHLGPSGIRFKLNCEQTITLPLYSVPNIYSFLACAVTCTKLGFSIEEIVENIKSNFSLPKGRGNLYKIKDIYLFDESYGGTSRSVSKAARSLVGFKPYVDKTIFIVGDMTEPGVMVEDRHLNLGHFLSALSIDYLITLGHYAKYIAQGASLIKTKSREVYSVENVTDLIEILKNIIKPNSAVSVKGLGNVVFHRIKSLIENLK